MLRTAVLCLLALAHAPVAADPARPPAPPRVVPAELPAILKAVREPGASAVLLNVWATWCDPCREEMPDLLRFYRDHKARGVRLILVSTDDPDEQAAVQKFLAGQGVDFPSFLHTGTDQMAFIDGLEPRWSGVLPASFLYDGRGARRHFWSGKVTYEGLVAKLEEISRPQTKSTKKKATQTQTRRRP